MYIITIALRHLRSRSISWVASALIALVVVIYLLVISVLEGTKEHWMDKLQNINAHITVDVGELAWGIQHPEKWASEVSGVDPGIRGVTIGLESPAMAIFDTARTVGTLRGVDLERELQYGRLKEILFPRDIKEFGMHEHGGVRIPGCIVGGAWRRSYNLSVGQRVTFLFSDEDDNPRSVAFAIIGFYEGENPYLEDGAYVDRKLVADKLGVSGMAKTLYVWLHDPIHSDLVAIRTKVRARVTELIQRDAPQSRSANLVRAETWQEKSHGFYKEITGENRLMRVIMCFFLVLLAFIVFLIFGRLVAEKVRDVGALRAMGATPAGVCSVFLAQALFIGLVGLAAGLLGAWVLIRNLNPLVEFIARVWGAQVIPPDLFGPGRILTRTLPIDVVTISAASVVSALVGAYIPARRASRINPVECLRHE